MKNSFLTATLLSLVAFSSTLFAQYDPSFNQLKWSEEFSEKGKPNESVWNYEKGFVRNSEIQYYTNDLKNVCVENGLLIIHALKEPGKEHEYTSGSINTRGKVDFFRGRIEVSAKIPTGIGTWPAIWMLGSNITEVGWPECGEIDIMENVGFNPTRCHFTVHTPGMKKDPSKMETGTWTEIPDLYTNFHVFAMEWHEDRLDFFVDQKRYFSYKKQDGMADYWKFDKPAYLLINLAIGGAWGGQKGLNETIFPSAYLIDWIRYYK